MNADRATEREANIFVSQLLMPVTAVRAACDELVAQSHDVDPATAMAARLDMPPECDRWQLFNLGLVGRSRFPRFDNDG